MFPVNLRRRIAKNIQGLCLLNNCKIYLKDSVTFWAKLEYCKLGVPFNSMELYAAVYSCIEVGTNLHVDILGNAKHMSFIKF